MRIPAVWAAFLLSSCSGLVARDLAGEHPPSAPASVGGGLLGAANEGAPQVVKLPSLGRWPRYLRSQGPFYGLIGLSPYVGQLGILSEKERADSGRGYGAVLGYRVPLRGATCLGIEFMYERSQHWNVSSDVEAVATRSGLALRMSFRMDEKVHPFAMAGGGLYRLEFDQLDPRFDLSGPGVFFGGGVDFSAAARLAVRAEMCLHIWDAAEESGHGGTAGTFTVGLGAAVSF